MKKAKWIIPVFIFLSIGFLILYLYKFDYLTFDDLTINYNYLIPSTALLWFGFFIAAFSWKTALKTHHIRIHTKEAIYSQGIAVFGKYIPGKIWVILGRASLVSKKDHPLLTTSTISLKEQLVYLMIGLVISLIALVFLPVENWYTYIVLLTIIGLGLFLFSKKIHDLAIRIIKAFLKKEINIPFVGLKGILPYAAIITLLWLCWSIGFYLLCLSVNPDTSFSASFAYPISICYSLLVIFIPGGIGVREGIITVFLIATGMEAPIATTISVISRLWFISGEIFIFILAVFFKPKKQIQNS